MIQISLSLSQISKIKVDLTDLIDMDCVKRSLKRRDRHLGRMGEGGLRIALNRKSVYPVRLVIWSVKVPFYQRSLLRTARVPRFRGQRKKWVEFCEKNQL